MAEAIGKCRCGKVVMAVTGEPVMTSACHCDGCKAMTASAFSLSAMVPEAGFSVRSGEVVLGGARTPGLDHYFCPDCKSWLFTRIEGLDGLVNLRSPLFDRPDWSWPFIETMTAEKFHWVEVPAVHAFEGFPPMDAFERLIDEYVDRRPG